jgi:long-chain acyl-CoA synthetase
MSGPDRKNGVPRGTAPKPPELDVARTLAGRTLLVTGATGFVGKVALSMLLHRYPDVGRVFVLVRPGAGGTAVQRFFEKIVPGRPFDPVRATHGEGFERFVREKCVPVAGDVSDPLLGLSEADLARMEGLAAVVNSAGLVDFTPSLELAVGVNVRGAMNAVELCRRLGAGLLHVSTCFVAGDRDGLIHEDEEIAGYFPRKPGVMDRPKRSELEGVAFSCEAELADVERRIAEVRARADDRVESSRFLDRAMERLRDEGRPTSDERGLKLAAGRERRLWISQQLVALGMDRARHWGWPNTYTYTKSLGEQAIAASGIPWSIVRPSIVESALRYPFPGWNEGFTTSAPLAFLGLKGQRVFPSAEKAIVDIVPVDLVAAGMIAATAELVERASTSSAVPAPYAQPERTRWPTGRVYHLGSGDTNPLWVARTVELTALYRRRFFREREEGNKTLNQLRSRLEPYPVSRRHFEAFSTPAFLALTRAAQKLVKEHAPRWGAPRLSALADEIGNGLDELESKLERTQAIWDLYFPFIWENRYVFRCAAMRALTARLAPADRARIPWDPEKLDWRHYWLEVHMKGLEEWVFPGLEEESERKVHPVKAHRDLVELLDAAIARHPSRTALRMTGERKDRFTYAELDRFAAAVQRFLAGAGVAKGDRVLLASENRPEWPIAYFGILRAGAVAVPVDAQLSARELENLWRTSGARVALLSEKTLARVPELAERVGTIADCARAVPLHEALAGGPPAAPPKVTQDDPASLIFTSGTTGTPKGVVLTHRNFASLVAKLAGVFDLGSGDGMLSVLPLHHTFEFTCGLLVPLSRGAEIEYLDELTADSIGDALESGRVTAMIGVPALWSLLHRKITQELSAKPGFVEGAMKGLMKANGWLRDRSLGVNLGKLLFWPVHRRFGGRLRILVSGGAALDPAVLTAFRELGFDFFQGYGLTEAAPVLAVSTPEHDAPVGSVGPPLPGIELRIESPDASGVGEVLARGPNVMLGYWRGGAAPGVDAELTSEVLEDGWLRTGDLGRLDADGNLHLVGRKKDVIIDATGKNVYPDELEELYREDDLVKELSVVGLRDGTGEKVAMLVVPRFEERDRAEVRARLDAHVRKVTQSLPFHQRVKVWHVTEAELPKTATRKVKRRWVQEELARLETAAAAGRRAREAAREQRNGGDGWVLDVVAEIARRPRAEITHQSTLAGDLALDSLLLNELAAALEQAGVPASVADDLPKLQTVGELARLAGGAAHRHDERAPKAGPKPEAKAESEGIPVPAPVAAVGRRILHAGQRALYHSVYDTKVVGEAFIPRDRVFLVVANHASHLDMGLVKIALGDEGERLAALAARDYFFDTPLKRAYFENFTNLIPMERSGALKGSLRAAAEALRRGHHLLIFPEGTRSRDGTLAPFHPTAGYLALSCGVDTLPAYLSGTHEAFPPGASFPKKADLEVRFGPPIAVDDLRARTASLGKSESYKAATAVMEEAILRLKEEAGRERERTKRRSAPRVSTTPSPPAVIGGAVERKAAPANPARKDREPAPKVPARIPEDDS